MGTRSAGSPAPRLPGRFNSPFASSSDPAGIIVQWAAQVLSETEPAGDLQLPCAGQVVVRRQGSQKGWIRHQAGVAVSRADAGAGRRKVILRIVHGVKVREVEHVESFAHERKLEPFVNDELPADAEVDVGQARSCKRIAGSRNTASHARA